MLLNSFLFLCIIPVVLFVYYLAVHTCVPKGNKFTNRVPNVLLLGISYAFFFYNQPVYTLLLFAMTLVTYLFGRIFDAPAEEDGHDSAASAESAKNRRRWLITGGVILILLPLGFFKYYNFLLDISSRALGAITGAAWSPQKGSWIVPLGISFFTFQALGYVWDVYYRRIRAEKNFIDYMLFVAFFPQIASGPISKASDLLPQIKRHRTIDWSDITVGIKLLLWGFFLKAVFADRMAQTADVVFSAYEHYSGFYCFIGSVMYSLQIYGDFAGYSLMAIGVARMLGFRLVNNFQRPYLSASVGEFWRRWHISLSTWLRDYVYIPLGGNRKGKGRSYVNLFVTFLVSGIWHGANLTFIVWGALHGIFQSIEKFFSIPKRPDGKLILTVRIIITFLLVNFAWIFFRMPTLKGAVEMIKRIFTCAPGASLKLDKAEIFYIMFALIVVVVKEIVEEWKPGVTLINHRHTAVRVFTYIALVFAILLAGMLDASNFIYVNF